MGGPQDRSGAGGRKGFHEDLRDHARFEFCGVPPRQQNNLFVGKESGRPPRVFLQDFVGGAARPVKADESWRVFSRRSETVPGNLSHPASAERREISLGSSRAPAEGAIGSPQPFDEVQV